MKTIGFIGLGLIGGSIAKAIRKYHEDYRLLAYDQDRETLAAAVSSNMIDAVCEEHDERFRSCDYIFLCAPVEFNVKYLEYFKDNIGPDTILTDVGSVKGIIHKEVERLGMESRFIGGHPMAGSEKTGFEASSDRLIENAYYIITPGGEVALERLTDFTEMISSLGAIPMVLTSEEHDFITAGVSHLPHIIASALVNLVNMLDSDQEYMKTIAAGGFRDITVLLLLLQLCGSRSVWKIIRISPMFWMTTSACWFRSNVLWITRTPGVCIRCLQVPGITVILLMW